MKQISNSDWALVEKILGFVAGLPRTSDVKFENIRRHCNKMIKKYERKK